MGINGDQMAVDDLASCRLRLRSTSRDDWGGGATHGSCAWRNGGVAPASSSNGWVVRATMAEREALRSPLRRPQVG